MCSQKRVHGSFNVTETITDMLGFFGKYLIKTLVSMAIMIGISSYLLYLRTGQTPWSLLGIHSVSDLQRAATPELNLQQLADQALRKAGNLTDSAKSKVADITDAEILKPAAPQQVYRWVDAQGVTHFSEQPPEGVTSVPVTLRPDRNVIQGLPQAEADNPENPPQAIQQQLDQISSERQKQLDEI